MADTALPLIIGFTCGQATQNTLS